MSRPTSNEDDDDSLYSGSPLPPPDTHRVTHQVLDAQDLSVQQLDLHLDDEDARYAEQHQPEEADEHSEDDYSTNGDESDDEGAKEDDSELEKAKGKEDDDDDDDDNEDYTGARVEVVEKGTSQGEESGDKSEEWECVDGGPVKIVDMDDENDDWFDCDEKKVDVESLESSSSSAEEVGDRRAPGDDVIGNLGVQRIEMSKSDKVAGTGSGRGKSLLTRASKTFYKAFRRGGGKKFGEMEKEVGSGDMVEEGEATVLDLRYARLDQVLEAQIATLNGAKTGFVDLTLLRPMTERTVEVIVRDGRELLKDFGTMERRAREMDKGGEEGEEGERELEMRVKEGMLIEAKVRLAEAAAEVERLRHELRMLQREMGDRERMEVRRWEMGKVKRERAGKEVEVASEARRAVEVKLKKEWDELEREENALQRVEKGFRDIQGDWE